jgi:putative ABC transport system substrate-binding protein
LNNRRRLIVVLGLSALVSPLSSIAQPATKIWRIGLLSHIEQFILTPRLDAFKAGMRELGYAEGRDYVIEQRAAPTDSARLPALAADLIALKVDVIVVTGTPSAVAARNATREIPIILLNVGDPVGSGLAASLRRPGANATGLATGVASELYTKRLDLLRQIVPAMRRAGYLYHLDNVSDLPGLAQFESDCAKLGFKSLRAPVRTAGEIAAAFGLLKREKAQGIIVSGSITNLSNAFRDGIIVQAAKLRLPAIYLLGTDVEAGGLVSYGANFPDLWRRGAAYADKIFKGAKPGDLPIEQPTRFELVLNMKTAKALGLKISNSVLVQATRVIN